MPIPTSTDCAEVPSLSEQINASTRSIHSKLNRLITERLTLALPPHCTNSRPYLTGLLYIAPIYLTFETLWDQLLIESYTPVAQYGLETFCAEKAGNTHKAPQVLSHLRIPGLARSNRLLADLQPLAASAQRDITVQILESSDSPPLAAFLAHIKLSVQRNPYVLLAYAWVLYMALFSGGRIMRAALQQLFMDEVDGGLHFFKFEGAEDGEDIRQEFKSRFADLAKTLSDEDKEDVVREARAIFTYLVDLVLELDNICQTGHPASILTQPGHGSLSETSLCMTARNKDILQNDLVVLPRKRNVQVWGFIILLFGWCSFRWWKYPSSNAVDIYTTEFA